MPLIDGLTRLYHSFGYECTKRNNMQPITDSIVLHSNGIHIQALAPLSVLECTAAPLSFEHVHTRTLGLALQLLDLEAFTQEHLPGLDGRGIGAICIHPSSR